MPVPTAVLLVPPDGDPHKLLGDPESVEWKCGARPPALHWYECAEHGGSWGEFGRFHCGTCGARTEKSRNRSALVLAADGVVLAAGWHYGDAAVRRKGGRTGRVKCRRSTPELAAVWAKAYVKVGLSAVVITLDADGREIASEGK